MNKLTGKELVTKAKECVKAQMGMTATCIECGYFNEVEGKQIPTTNTFQRELLKAAGFDFTSGRQMLGDEVKINANGTIVLSPTRTKQARFEPGDELQIIHNPTNNSFTLKKVS